MRTDHGGVLNKPSNYKHVIIAFGILLTFPAIFGDRSIGYYSTLANIFAFVGVALIFSGLIVRKKIGCDRTLGMVNQASERTIVEKETLIPNPKEIRVRSLYYRFAKILGLSPALPLVLFILTNIACSSFENGLGGICKNPGYGHVYWREVFAILGMLGWLFSLPAWAFLEMLGRLSKIR
jgi:hypothetical protein